MRQYSIPREKVVLLTKCYGTVGEEPAMVSTLVIWVPVVWSGHSDFADMPYLS